jgi:acetyltransferase
VRFTQIDYDREMAFIATVREGAREVEIAVGRYASNPDGDSCEFAIVVGDRWQGRGLARRMMEALIAVARARRLKVMMGYILGNNTRMLALAAELGFYIETDPQDPSHKRVIFDLQADAMH